MKTRICLALLLIMLSCTLNARPKPEAPKDDQSLTGVWQGKLGDSAITVCFNPMQYGSQSGSYFYNRHLEPIHLDGDKALGQFTEYEQPGPLKHRWRLQVAADGKQLTGGWTKDSKPGDTPQMLPITLQRVKGGEYVENDEKKNRPCASDAYFQKLEGPLPLIRGKEEEFEGKRFQKIWRQIKGKNAGKVESIQILEDDPKYQAINSLLLNAADTGEMVSCRREGIGAGMDGSWDARFHGITLWGQRWFVTNSSASAFCGGAHPEAWFYRDTFDLDKGKVTNLTAWFKNIESKPLKKLILAYSQAAKYKNNDCLESLELLSNSYTISLAKNGINFSPNLPHVVQSCGEDIIVPYTKLTPFLTRLGKEETAKLIEGNF